MRKLDDKKNVVAGLATLVDVQDSVVLGHKGRPIAVIGVKDLVVVDAGDALLICPKNRCQDVRKVVEALTQDKAGKKFL